MEDKRNEQTGIYLGTQSRILAAAEKIFAERGIGMTSLRSIVRAADVNLAAVHYHFGSKEKLVLAALKRAIDPVISCQIQRLTLEAKRLKPLSIEAVLRAYFAPVGEEIYLKKGEKGLIQTCFVGRCCTDPETEDIATQEFMPSRKLFIYMFQQVLPNNSRAEIEWKFDLVTSIFIQLLRTSYHPSSLFQNRSSNEMETTVQHVVRFIAAGMRSMQVSSSGTSSTGKPEICN